MTMKAMITFLNVKVELVQLSEEHMRLCEYAKMARSTAIYPADDWFVYPSMGVGGEIGELCEKLDCGDIPGIRKEMGDVLWYVANTAIDAGLRMDELVDGCETFADLQRVPFADVTPLKMAANALVICELAKKFLRDDGGKMFPTRREKVKLALGTTLLSLTSLCRSLRQFDLAEIAEENNTKLRSRKERGKLQGSGDNR